MKFRELSIEGAWEVTPQQHGDPRGLFMEWYRFDHLSEVVGHPLRMAQGNLSVSAKDVVRGIHFADVPPGQAKYVSCVRGAVLDVIVDLRVGSPTFGHSEFVRLDDVDRRSVYISEGLGHGFCALTDDATLSYVCSETYNPTGEHAVHPLDPDLAIEWPTDAPQLSARDDAAPTLAQALETGLLPDYEECLRFRRSLSGQ
ncbi:dTDP-4-dehydrorhamnose 3,5-epimerase family protein [Kitasatospora purpeofusca]|uniref:dTDP-4-dehydrorhamnose 3,5-epimerase family protein n=1 Tax=Kitasatospora purpeofusca TaxID=67352 RepID=UPI00224E081E|nr:dTDP-4-dehydrorhamnose 3,5-epimerase family protein [Kitasatospora purpeofusca]MCX4753327.1 dTDP-4-dehydrorhamnose 3,5-epimerase family protein [Kitasatospora purpeofusca]WSR32837.1 dTDP-4-dehydrorhamnose 3,5-epimerase family protein [Kitasatospora purpeofusca]